ncbi:3899_t:CDS:2, partial [Acaulospora colombiana]
DGEPEIDSTLCQEYFNMSSPLFDEAMADNGSNRPVRQMTNSGKHSLKERLKQILESRRFHFLILFLLFVDFACILAILLLTFFDPISYEHEEHYVVVILSEIAFIINTLFLIEVLLNLICFGIRYFLTGPRWGLHLFDATVVLTSVAVGVEKYDHQKLEDSEKKVKKLEAEFKQFVVVVEEVAKEEHWNEEKKQRVFKGREVEKILNGSTVE